jgi:hypothetical protein
MPVVEDYEGGKRDEGEGEKCGTKSLNVCAHRDDVKE